MIVVSSSWLANSELGLAHALDALQGVGARCVEFNHRMHPLDLQALRGELARRDMAVASLHNVCSEGRTPVPDEDRYGDAIAALDESARVQGARWLRETADAARALGARAVIVHGGTVDALKNSPEYRRAIRQSERKRDPGIAREVVTTLLAERERMAHRHVEQLIRSLREVCPDYPELRFGLEVRYHFYHVPSFAEMGEVLAAVNLPHVGYWHDCGHGQFQENLGVHSHEDWLRAFGHRMFGVHLHGLLYGIVDHFSPTPDNIDLEMVRRYVPADAIRVLELSPQNRPEAVRAGIEYLETVFGVA